MSAATEQARSLLTAHFTDEYVGYVCRSGLLSVLAGEVESLSPVVDAARRWEQAHTQMRACVLDSLPWRIAADEARKALDDVRAALAVVGHPQGQT